MISKKVIYFILVVNCFVFSGVTSSFARPSERVLDYSIEPIFQGNETRLKIIFSFKGDASGETYLNLPQRFASQRELFKGIENIKAITQSVSIENYKKPHIRLVKHKPNQQIKISYDLIQYNKNATHSGRGGGYSPILQQNYLHFIGSGTWIIPDSIGNEKINVNLNWENLPKDWNLANSFGVNKSKQSFSTTKQQFSSAIFVAGDYRINKSLIKGKPIYTALRGKWSFTDKQFSDLVSEIVEIERGFWKDYNHPFYLVTLLPLEVGRGMSIGGTGLTNSFGTFVSNNAPIERLGWLIAHEYFHNWNYLSFGGLKQPEQLLYWFSEGFTDYYTYLLLLRGGLISFDDYIAKYNEFTESYFISPVRNVDNQRILKDFFRDGDVSNLPYRRGFLLATKWNHIIKTQTKGKKSIDDIMRDILNAARKGNFKKLSKDKIIEHLSKYANYDFANDIEKYIEKGETINGFENELGSCVEVSQKQLGTFELGFDFPSTREKKVIVGVKENSEAYKNGLRDGQQVRGFSFQNGNTKFPVTLTVFVDKAEKKITYLPVTQEKTKVPIYNLKSNLSESQKKNCQKEF